MSGEVVEIGLGRIAALYVGAGRGWCSFVASETYRANRRRARSQR